MSDHLPECGIATADPEDLPYCICDRLRAVEQRVRKEECIAYEEAVVLAEAESYAEGVKAARDAVEALLHDDPCDCYECRALVAALAAIDGVSNGLGPKS
jgi:hypothetical protein